MFHEYLRPTGATEVDRTETQGPDVLSFLGLSNHWATQALSTQRLRDAIQTFTVPCRWSVGSWCLLSS